jgi:hypothetical protein
MLCDRCKQIKKLENNFAILIFSAKFKIKKLENCFKALHNSLFEPGLKIGMAD